MRRPAVTSVLLVVGVILALVSDLLPGCAVEPEENPRLSARLDEARVTATVKGRVFELKPAGPALYAAGLPAWNWVGPRPMRTSMPKKSRWDFAESTKPGEAEDVCLWVHPVNDGKLTLEFPQTPLGGRLVGFFHAPRSASPKMKVQADVLVNGERVKRLQPNLKPGGIWDFDLALPGAGTGHLAITIVQAKRGKNHLCFDGVVHAE